MKMAPAIPVPIAITTTSRNGAAAPRRYSASPAPRTSWLKDTGMSSVSLARSRKGWLRQPRFSEKTPTPLSSSTWPGTRSPADCGWTSGWSMRSSRASSPIRVTTAPAVLSPSIGVRTRTTSRMLPTSSTRAAFMSVPPTANASTALPAPSDGAGCPAAGELTNLRVKDHGTGEVARLVGVEPGAACALQGHPLRPDQVGHGIDGTVLVVRARRSDVGHEALGCCPEHPRDPAGRRDRNRTVAILLGRVRLGPRLRGLAHLEGGLVGEADRPARAQEGVLRRCDELLGQLGCHGLACIRDGARDVLTQRGSKEGEHGRGETRLHHGLLVGKRKLHDVVDKIDQGRVRVPDQGDRADAAPHTTPPRP